MNGKAENSFFFSIFLGKNVLPQHVMQSSLILMWLVIAAWPQCPRMNHFTTTVSWLHSLSSLVSQMKKLPTKLTLNSLCILNASLGKLHRNVSEMLKLHRAVLVGSYLSKEYGISVYMHFI